MMRRLLSHGAAYGLALGLSSALSIALLPLYTRWLEPAQLGAFDLLQAVIVLANMILPLEVVQGVSRFYPEETDPQRRRGLTASGWWFTAAVFSAAFLAVAPFGRVMGPHVFGEAQPIRTVLLALAAVWASGLCYYCGNQFRWKLQPGWSAAFQIGRVVLTHLVSLGLVKGGWGLSGLVTGLLLGAGLPVAVWAVINREELAAWPDRATLRELLRFSAPIVPASISVFLALWIDRLAINQLMTLGDVGRYGVALRFASVVTLVATGFQQALMPLVYSAHRDPATPGQLAKLFRAAVWLSLSAVLFLDLFGRDVLRLLVAEAYRDVDGVISLLAAAACATSLASFAPGLIIAKRTGRAGLIHVLSAVVNTVLNFALIPYLGLNGAALATLCGGVLTLLLFLRASQASYPVPHNFRKLAGGAGLALLVVAIHRSASGMMGDGVAALTVRSSTWVAAAGVLGWILIVSGEGGVGALLSRVLRRRPPVPVGEAASEEPTRRAA